MREIKFRGFHKPSKTWLTHEESLSIIMLQGRTIAKQADGTDLLERHVIEQFTGLSDKNGVDIYEGDIVDDEFSVGQLRRIYYCDQTASFMAECLGHLMMGTSETYCTHLSTSPRTTTGGNVVGNIHENPELLT